VRIDSTSVTFFAKKLTPQMKIESTSGSFLQNVSPISMHWPDFRWLEIRIWRHNVLKKSELKFERGTTRLKATCREFFFRVACRELSEGNACCGMGLRLGIHFSFAKNMGRPWPSLALKELRQ
jgi:hypothetical protein